MAWIREFTEAKHLAFEMESAAALFWHDDIDDNGHVREHIPRDVFFSDEMSAAS